ncbi:FecR family protein [Chitinophaga silvatica]|uniref:FecR family protein n=1 Tax=Chitinophaga silvatica TaxID=2282649 RepID=A0A3E1YDV3_9BACT|nr:FecR family protein [Chitinophaga silvatica]RFS24780.1 FecR family protein [Chitinophaga silvatica]
MDRTTTVKVVKYKWWKLGAAAALLMLITAWGLKFYNFSPEQQLVLNTGKGERKKIVLQDSTEIWLNVGSSLSYPATMSNRRTVDLQGEAFFEVTKNSSKPFVVHAADLNIKVLGTKFNVKAYKDEDALETSLVEGSIAITYQANSITLKAGEKLTLRKKNQALPIFSDGKALDWGDKIAIIEKLNAEANSKNSELEWIDNKLSFKDKSFPQLARLMSRWYNRKIILADTFPEDYKFKGTFKQETAIEVLQALQVTADFRYTIKGDTIFLHH